jgi:hypothetical protein
MVPEANIALKFCGEELKLNVVVLNTGYVN